MLELPYSLTYLLYLQIATRQLKEYNYYDDLKARFDYDLAVLGIGAVKHSFNNTHGIKLDSIGNVYTAELRKAPGLSQQRVNRYVKV